MARKRANDGNQEKAQGGAVASLKLYADWVAKYRPDIKHATVAVREATIRRALKISKKAPLEFKGLQLRCVGSKRWRTETQGTGVLA